MSVYQFIDSKSIASDWLPIAVGLLFLYVPTFYSLATGLWTNEDQAHGPIILLLSLWLMIRQWPDMLKISDGKSITNSGWVVFLAALLCYVIGRSQQILVFEISSFILILSAILLIKRGFVALKVMWFPLFFL